MTEPKKPGKFTPMAPSKVYTAQQKQKGRENTHRILSYIIGRAQADGYPVCFTTEQLAAAVYLQPSTTKQKLQELKKAGIIREELDRKSSGTTEIIRMVWINE